MARTAILYVNLLGVQKMWKAGGAAAVKARIEEFNEFILAQLEWLPRDLHRQGEYTAVLGGDSVSIICQDYPQAIGIGIHLFTQAFFASNRMVAPFWFRGAISGWSNQYMVMNTVPIEAKGLQIGTRYKMEDDHLGVLALEKSGFKGMRLLLNRRVVESYTYNSEYCRGWSTFTKPLSIITRLRDCTYPSGMDYADVLWMADQEDRYVNLRNIMASRFKRSTRDSDEFTQAAWTRAVFDQVDTLIWSCSRGEETAEHDDE